MNTNALETRPVGKSGVEISLLGLGCWMMGGSPTDYWGGFTEQEGVDLVSAALEMGVTYFDEAEMYNDGRSEEALGRALKGRRDRATIGTKINPLHCAPGRVRTHLEGSLRRLDTDYVDIYMIHWPVREYPLEGVLEELDTLRGEGKIRAIGVSNFGPIDLAAAVATGVPISLNQMHYNMLSRAIEAAVVPLAVEHSIGIMGYMSLLQGILSGKYETIDEIPANRLRTRHFRGDRPQSRHGGPGAEEEVNRVLKELKAISQECGIPTEQLALAWCAAKPWMTCVLAGARTPEQLQSNMEGVTRKLDAGLVAKLDALTQPLFEMLGSNPDYWQSGADSRIR